MNSTFYAHNKFIIFLKVSLLGSSLVMNGEIFLRITDFVFHTINTNQQSEFGWKRFKKYTERETLIHLLGVHPLKSGL